MKKQLQHIILFLLLLSASHVIGQQKYLKRGSKAYRQQNYVEATTYYKKALTDARRTLPPARLQELVYRLGNAYLQMNQYENALPWLEEAVLSSAYNEDYQLAYAEALALNQEITKAIDTYRKVLEKNPSSNYSRERIETLKRRLEDIPAVVNLRSEAEMNSPKSDYAPAWYFDKLVFASARSGKSQSKNYRTGQYYSDLFVAEYNGKKGRWENPKPLSDRLNSRKAEGNFVFDQGNRIAYFTRCFDTEKPCHLMKTHLLSGGEWSRLEKISFTGNYATGHPTLSADGSTLFFVSGMEGGWGGKDIWKIRKLDDGNWSVPVNLGGNVNSGFDEMFPYFAGDSLLFFASDRGQAIGGLDIFVSKKGPNGFEKPIHLEAPYNSPQDDFGMIIREGKALFCSNRNNETQSDDIYSFSGWPFLVKVSGQIRNKATGKGVPLAGMVLKFDDFNKRIKTDSAGTYTYRVPVLSNYNVVLNAEDYKEKQVNEYVSKWSIAFRDTVVSRNYWLAARSAMATIKGKVTHRKSEELMDGETVKLFSGQRLLDTAKTNQAGIYIFDELSPEKTYTVKISKDGFFSESRQCTVPELERNAVFSKANGYDMDFKLTRIQQKEEIVINNIFYDFNKATLRPESREELDKLVSMLRETPNVIIQINSHSDSRGGDSYNRRLSQRRAQSVVGYLTKKGIADDRLYAKGYGETRPLVENATTEAEHQLNRRTSFKVLAVLERKASAVPDRRVEDNKGEQKTSDNRETTRESDLVYRVQVLAVQNRKPESTFDKLTKNIPATKLYIHQSDGTYKYEIGQRLSYGKAVELRTNIVNLGFKDCFITAYHRGNKISVGKAKRLENQDR